MGSQKKTDIDEEARTPDVRTRSESTSGTSCLPYLIYMVVACE
ncbi:hypothetical protein Hanom_Chr11g01012981 [Helianthus anomalus]